MNIDLDKVDLSRVGDWFIYDTAENRVLAYGATPIAASWAAGFGPCDTDHHNVVMSRVAGRERRAMGLPQMDCCRRAVEGVLEELFEGQASLRDRIRERADRSCRERIEGKALYESKP